MWFSLHVNRKLWLEQKQLSSIEIVENFMLVQVDDIILRFVYFLSAQ